MPNILFIVLIAISIFLCPLSKAFSKGYFHGNVIKIDALSKTFTLRISGKPVTFDASNPSFKGYRGLDDIKTGDWVNVMYTKEGIKIIKSTASYIKEKPLTEKDTVKHKKTKNRIERVRTPGNSFRDVDNNKDGKITPVELSVIIPKLTIQQFKDYDKNGDGSLDPTEYLAVIKGRQ